MRSGTTAFAKLMAMPGCQFIEGGMATPRSQLFTAYNLMRHQAALGRVDSARLKLAFSVCLQKEERPYVTTLTECSCPIFENRYKRESIPCKHMIALALKEIVNELQNDAAPPSA